MRRFLVDALLVLLLVSLASYINEPKEKESLEHQIDQFEDEVAQHAPLHQKVETTRLNDIEENAAAKLAQEGSGLIIDVMEKSLDLVSELVHGFCE